MTVEYFYGPFRRFRLSDLGMTLKEKGDFTISDIKESFRVYIRKNAFEQFFCGRTAETS